MEEIKKAKDRLEVLEKIKRFEREGKFDVDVEEDPPTIELLPNQIDYKRKKIINKIKRHFAYKGITKFVKNLIKNKLFQIKEFRGLENLRKVETGAILTCNHFAVADSFLMQIAFMAADLKNKRMYRVIREGNYTNPPAGFEAVMRYCDTLPLSQNKATLKKFLKATNELIQEGNFVLVYPEESMWWNYRKPKPLKNGAFRFAVKNNVPVIPMFITMEDSDVIAPDGFPVQAHTINIGEPIYPDENLEYKENLEYLKNKNFKVWKDIYESFYGVKLSYDTIVNENTEDIVKKYAKKVEQPVKRQSIVSKKKADSSEKKKVPGNKKSTKSTNLKK